MRVRILLGTKSGNWEFQKGLEPSYGWLNMEGWVLYKEWLGGPILVSFPFIVLMLRNTCFMFCAVAPWHWTYGCTSFHLIKEAYFFGSNFEEWVYLDLISQISYDTSILWSKLWAMTYYFLWIWHSKHIHNFDFVMPFRSWCVILERYKDYNASALANPMNMVRTKHHIQSVLEVSSRWLGVP